MPTYEAWWGREGRSETTADGPCDPGGLALPLSPHTAAHQAQLGVPSLAPYDTSLSLLRRRTKSPFRGRLPRPLHVSRCPPRHLNLSLHPEGSYMARDSSNKTLAHCLLVYCLLSCLHLRSLGVVGVGTVTPQLPTRIVLAWTEGAATA